MDTRRQDLLRDVINMVRDDLQGGGRSAGEQNARQRRQAALLRMVESDDAPVRWIAIRELGQMGDLAAAEALMPLTTDPSPDLARAAQAAVRQIGEREAGMPRRAASPPPPPPLGPRDAGPPMRAAPPPPPPPPRTVHPAESNSKPVVEAHMGRSRDTRMTKGQDLPVPPTETQLGALLPESTGLSSSLGEAYGVLAPLPAIPDPVAAPAAMAPLELDTPAIPGPAPMADADRDHPFPGM